MITKGKLTLMAVLASALVLSVACTSGAPGPTQTGNNSNTQSNGSGAVSTGMPLFLGGSTAEAAGFSSYAPGYSGYAAPQASYGYQPQSGIWASGSGRVVITPDLALLSIGVEAIRATVEEARTEAAQAMAAVMDVLKEHGIEEKDIRTEYFNIYPQYVWNDFNRRQEITGYQVTNSISVKSRDLEDIGSLIDDVSAAAGNLVRVNGVTFTTEKADVYAAQAREAAVKDAMAKARQFADLTEVTLGKLVYISETGGNIPVAKDYLRLDAAVAESGAAAPTPITPGEMEVTIYVQAIFGIE